MEAHSKHAPLKERTSVGFSTEVAAVQALGAEGHCAAKKGRSQRETAEVAIRRFKALKKIWRNWLPADMAHQVTFQK